MRGGCGLSRRDVLTLAAAAPLAACMTTGGTTQRPAPRLLVTADDITRTREAIAHDPLPRDWYEAVCREADALLTVAPMDRVYEPHRRVMLVTSRRVLERVRLLGGLWLLTGDARYAERANTELAAAAAFPDWNPSHFLDTAEMSHAFALGLDWLGDAMTPAERTHLREALIAKGIEPGLEAHARGAHWSRGTSNWNLVCNGGLVLAALAVEREEPERAARLIEQCVASAPRALASYAPDGAWDEGVSYWNYATQYTAFLIAGLETARGPSALAQSPGLAETGLFGLHMMGPSGLVFDFADAVAENEAGPEMFWLARRFDRPLYASWYRPVVGERPTILDLLWYDPRRQSAAEAGVPTCAYFRHVEAVSLRGAWDDPRATWIAFKGGDNTASHGNLDLGTFVLECSGARFAIELGGDDYGLPGYFEWPQRYEYYRTSSSGQNLFMPDGRNQDLRARAAIAHFDPTPDDACAVVDLDAAWPALASARRGIALVARRHAVIIDEAERRAALPWIWRMHTRAAISIDGARAVLRQDGATLHMRIVEPAGARFSAEPLRLSPPQQPTEGINVLAVRLAPASGPIRLAIIASPEAQAPAAVIARARRPLAAWRV